MYNTHSCISHIPNFTLWHSEKKKKLSYIIYTNFLEFVAVKFNLDIPFVQLFIGSYWLKIRIYIVCYILKQKIYTVFTVNIQTCSHKNATSLGQK